MYTRITKEGFRPCKLVPESRSLRLLRAVAPESDKVSRSVRAGRGTRSLDWRNYADILGFECGTPGWIIIQSTSSDISNMGARHKKLAEEYGDRVKRALDHGNRVEIWGFHTKKIEFRSFQIQADLSREEGTSVKFSLNELVFWAYTNPELRRKFKLESPADVSSIPTLEVENPFDMPENYARLVG
jgi:hypothetical protein